MDEDKQELGPRARGYFRDRAIVVTGASSGIGQDIALSFGRQGAQVALLARRKTKLEELADRIKAAGGRALVLQCDVTRRAEVQSAIDEATRSFGQIDILVNSAGLLIPDTVEDLRPEDLERMIGVNLYGAVHTIQAVLPQMKKARAGRIVNLGSLSGRRGLSPLGGYAATKFALVGLTESLRVELFGSGVWVSLVMPGVIDTPMSQEARSNQLVRGVPVAFAMPVRWVTWAVMAAVIFGMPEVAVPPGAAILEKLASLFPLSSDAVLSFGTRIVQTLGARAERIEPAPKQVPEKVVRPARRGEAAQSATS